MLEWMQLKSKYTEGHSMCSSSNNECKLHLKLDWKGLGCLVGCLGNETMVFVGTVPGKAGQARPLAKQVVVLFLYPGIREEREIRLWKTSFVILPTWSDKGKGEEDWKHNSARGRGEEAPPRRHQREREYPQQSCWGGAQTPGRPNISITPRNNENVSGFLALIELQTSGNLKIKEEADF